MAGDQDHQSKSRGESYQRSSVKVKLQIAFALLCCYGVASYSMDTIISVITSIAKQLEGPTAPPIYHDRRIPPQKLLTLFTTARATEQKVDIQKNTILNWSLLKARVNLIFYTSVENTSLDEELQNYALENEFTVRDCPDMSEDIPILRSMFIEAENISDTPYYGYANGDILFTDGLLQTLESLYDYHFKNVLMVGRRTNYNVTRGGIQTYWGAIKMAATMNGSLFGTNAQDYFITTKGGFPWQNIPDFVVGRIGYDNWLVVTSILLDIPVVDLTRTVLAVHQTGIRGNFEGHRNKTKGVLYTNYRLAGRFDYSLGKTSCSQFITTTNGTTVELVYRDKNDCFLLYRRRRKNSRLFIHAIQELPDVNSTETVS